MTRIIVDVMLKPEILDPQGQAVKGALARLGLDGVADVRQGKQFVIDVDPAPDASTIEHLAGTLLSNPVIEDYRWRVDDDAESVGAAASTGASA
ncbi:MAG: phosphoribosylformylglycinamidine synthase subunit PurS [Actinomycetota bacterium]|nr:phosphoribosylformylglycinamidine synthase subunit PurS [Actinomycetota bacterium]